MRAKEAGAGRVDTVTCEEIEELVLAGREQGDPSAQKAPARTRERCRQAARRLAARGEVVITQAGRVTDPSFTKGVMELKLP
jgi:hypothetical protein